VVQDDRRLPWPIEIKKGYDRTMPPTFILKLRALNEGKTTSAKLGRVLNQRDGSIR